MSTEKSFLGNISKIFTSTPKSSKENAKRKANRSDGVSPEQKRLILAKEDDSEHEHDMSTSVLNDSSCSGSRSSENSDSDSTNDSSNTTLTENEETTNTATVLQKFLLKLGSLEQSYKDLVKTDGFNSAKYEEHDKLINSLEYKLKKQCNVTTALEVENAKLKHSHTTLVNRVNQLEIELRKSNLVFTGIQDNGIRDDVWLRATINSCLNHITQFYGQASSIPIKAFYRRGVYNRKFNRPVLIEFSNYADVMIIMENKHQLPRGVFVHEDLPLEIESNRLKMFKIYLYAKKNGYQKRCRMERDKLIIDSKTIGVNNLKDLPEDLHPKNTCERRTDEIVAFFGEHSPLSNFHQCQIKYDGYTYSSVEQILQSEKADLYDADEEHAKILHTDNPSEIKQIGKSIPYVEQQWSRESKEIVKKACWHKFSQQEQLRKYLLNTKDCLLVEASPDTVWGSGIHLRNEDCLNPNVWRGDNQLGKILMEVRDMLINDDKRQEKLRHQLLCEVQNKMPLSTSH